MYEFGCLRYRQMSTQIFYLSHSHITHAYEQLHHPHTQLTDNIIILLSVKRRREQKIFGGENENNTQWQQES